MCIYVDIYIYIYVDIHVYIYIYACICMCIYTYIYMYMVTPPIDPYFLASTTYRGRIPPGSPYQGQGSPKFLGHLGFGDSKDLKQLTFESRLKSKIEDCKTSFTVSFNHPWTSRVGVSKV